MAKASISADMLHLGLKQLGATKVHSHLSKVMIIKFEINSELTVSYFCYVKDEEKIYIQRIEPYPVRNYRFETIENILSFIKKDVELFRNASKSRNFNLFLDMISQNFEVRKEIEDLFLSNNVSPDILEKFIKAETELLNEILNSEHIALNEDIEKYSGEEMTQKNTLEKRIDKDERASSYVKDIYDEKEIVHPAVLSNMVKDMVDEAVKNAVRELKKEIIDELKK